MQTELEKRIRSLRDVREILLMSHCVLGYKSVEDNRKLVTGLAQAGVELIELQFPFSEPIADGPVLIKANHDAVRNGISTDECFSLARELVSSHPDTLFLIMTYFNVIFRRGARRFVKQANEAGVLGIIVPDLPVEEAGELLAACDEFGVSPILLVTPASSEARLKEICRRARGMIYCVARKGVTGAQTLFSAEFHAYLERVKSKSTLPLGVGFGIQSAEDVKHLSGKADIAIVCTQVIAAYANQGVEAAASLVAKLR